MDYKFQIEKKKIKKCSVWKIKNMNHSARGDVCVHSHARHIFNRLKNRGGIYTLLIWIGYKCNVLELHTTMRHTAHMRNSSFAQTIIL